MIGEIVAIGDELISGRITNTTSGYAAQKLAAAGYPIRSIHTIGDAVELIGPTIETSLKRADFVIITGGLGSTTDDLTNEAVIQALGLKGIRHPEIIASIQARLPQPSASQRAAMEKLAWVPEDATILDDAYRMAGYILAIDGTPLFFLPGVPPQMEQLLTSKVIPELERRFPRSEQGRIQRLYRTFGLAEAEINARLLSLEEQEGVQLGYYPVGCEVHLSLGLNHSSQEALEPIFQEIDDFIRKQLGPALYGMGETSMAAATGSLLAAAGKTLCVAESCTGGLIASKLTQVAGSSRWFAGGVVAYSNRLKELLLNVDHALLTNYGAVSPEAARAMAARLAAKVNCDTGVSVTGIAGPDGGTQEKPVGTVYIGLFHDKQVTARLHRFSGTRTQIQELTALTALDTVRRALLNN
ncbi:CinA family nicotinamide mononucleotide deamidase-related protein [Desulfogranum mediterraneum]|uniref:CinA family nicotinamide mononucleotide deamidase-related protein n=1 Tax=Desulfogranum mediterraneum TaxID=160661 RepID=UPI0004025296|nr:CinA family nicotinamide mononucleotide deamidase-related protein [Desulfogranum mediterraneum]